MSINSKRPVITYENVALFQGYPGANSTINNSGDGLKFLPNVIGIDFSFETQTQKVGALGTKNLISNTSNLSPDINLNIRTSEGFGHLFSGYVQHGDSVRSDLNVDTNIYAVVGSEHGRDVSGQNLSGLDVLSFGNCFLNNVSVNQSAGNLMQSTYSFTCSNVQAQKLEHRIMYFNDFDHLTPEDYAPFRVGGRIYATDLEDNRGLKISNRYPQGGSIGTGEGIVQTANASGMPGVRSLAIYDGGLINGISFSGLKNNTLYQVSGTSRSRHGQLSIRYITGGLGGTSNIIGQQHTVSGEETQEFQVTGKIHSNENLPTASGAIVVAHRKMDYTSLDNEEVPVHAYNPTSGYNKSNYNGESTFTYVAAPGLTWYEAREAAVANYGRLAVFDTTGAYLKFQNDMVGVDFGKAWIGLTDTGNNSDAFSDRLNRSRAYKWINGVNNIITGGTEIANNSGFVFDTEPNSFGEDFVHIKAYNAASQTGAWNDCDSTCGGTVAGYIRETIQSSSFISDLTIRAVDEYEIKAPSLDLTGSQEQNINAYFSGMENYYENNSGSMIPYSDTYVNIRRNDFDNSEYKIITTGANAETPNSKIVFNLQSTNFNDLNQLQEVATNVHVHNIEISGTTFTNEERTTEGRGAYISKVGHKDGQFNFISGGQYDIYQEEGSQHAAAEGYNSALEFLSGFSDTDLLVLTSDDALIQSGRSDSHTNRLIEFADIMSGFGAKFDEYRHRNAYIFVGTKKRGKIYEENGDYDASIGQQNAEPARATIFLPDEIDNFFVKPDMLQTMELNLPVNRKTIRSLGKSFPVKRKALYPNVGQFNLSTLVSDFVIEGNQTQLSESSSSNLKLLSREHEYTLEITGSKTTNETFSYKIKDAKINSQSFSNGIGGRSLLDFSFNFDSQKIVGGQRMLNEATGIHHAYSIQKINSNYTGYAMTLKRREGNVIANVEFDEEGKVGTRSKISYITGGSSAKNLHEFINEEVGTFNDIGTGANVYNNFSSTVFSGKEAFIIDTRDVHLIKDSTYTFPSDFARIQCSLDTQIPSGRLNRCKVTVEGTVVELIGSINIKPSESNNAGGTWTPVNEGTIDGLKHGPFKYEFAGASGAGQPGDGTKAYFDFRGISFILSSGEYANITGLKFSVTEFEPSLQTWYDQAGDNNIRGYLDMEPYLKLDGAFSYDGNTGAGPFEVGDGTGPTIRIDNREERAGEIDGNISAGTFDRPMDLKNVNTVMRLHQKTGKASDGNTTEIQGILGTVSGTRGNDIFYFVTSSDDNVPYTSFSMDGRYEDKGSLYHNEQLLMSTERNTTLINVNTGEYFHAQYYYADNSTAGHELVRATGIDGLGFIHTAEDNVFDGDEYGGYFDMKELILSSGIEISGQSGIIVPNMMSRYDLS